MSGRSVYHLWVGPVACSSTVPCRHEFPLSPPLIFFPLLAAVLFATGALLLKRSAQWPIDVWRTSFVSNLSTALASMPLLLAGGSIPHYADLWQPLVVGILFVLGQVTAIIALTKGEVSVAAPVFGLKIVMVAIFSWLITGNALPPSLWASALIATCGVMLLNVGATGQHRGSVVLSVTMALSSALSFSLFDVCVQIWAPVWGVGRLLPIAFLAGALLSFVFVPFFRGPLRDIPLPARPWLATGCGLFAMQSMMIAGSVAIWGHAAIANVFYSTRGLWGVILAWGLGPLFGVADGGLQGRVVWFRLAGATLLLIAVLLLIL